MAYINYFDILTTGAPLTSRHNKYKSGHLVLSGGEGGGM